jgi:hypothetical protein
MNYRSIVRCSAVAMSMLLGSGCATITRGTTEAWTVESDPAGANVTLSSGETCKTPCTLTKKRKDPFMVTVEKEGHETVQTQILSQVAGAGAAGMAGNVLIGGLIGIGVDAASGATKELKPNPLVLKLVKVSGSVSALPEEPAPSGGESTETTESAEPDGR